MNPETLQKAIEIFDVASDMPSNEREAYLMLTCGPAGTLREEVDRLLHGFQGAELEGFLQISPLARLSPFGTQMQGKQIGPYRLLRQIGSGGMGTVHLAIRTDDTFEKQVAVKLVWPSLHVEKVLRRFRQERHILAQLDHPHIARLYDAGATDEGSPYLVMEYVDGVPITEYCDGNKLMIPERLRLFRTVCGAVEFAHKNLVVHRDLKPANIFVTRDGDIKLLDFGIAKLLKPGTADAENTLTTVPFLTPHYASPEQILGERITTASDVYSLGVILYELLSGHRPRKLKGISFAELTRQLTDREIEAPSKAIDRIVEENDSDAPALQRTLEAICRNRKTQPRLLRRQLEDDLDTIVLKALRRDPAERYNSTAQLSEDIGRHLDGNPVLARRPTFAYVAKKYIRNHKARAAFGLALVLLVIAALIVLGLQVRRDAIEAESKRRELYAADMRQAQEYWHRGNFPLMRVMLEKYIPETNAADKSDDLRGFEWYYLWRLVHDYTAAFSYETVLHSMAVSPDGNTVATGMRDGSVLIRDLESGKVRFTLQGENFIVRAIAYSPDGKKLLAGNAGGIARLWDAGSGKEILSFKGHATGRILSVAFTSNGKAFVTGGEDRSAKLWEAETGRLLHEFSGHKSWVGAVAFSRDGKWLATGGPDVLVRLWDLATGKLQAILPGYEDDIWRIGFTPDNKYLVAGGNERPAILWRLSDRTIVRRFDQAPRGSHSFCLSPDGKRLALTGLDRVIRLFDVESGNEIAQFRGSNSYVGLTQFTPDGEYLVSIENFFVRVWSIQQALRLDRIQVCTKCVLRSIDLSPDGQILAAGEGREPNPNDLRLRAVGLWDAASVKLIGYLEGNEGGINEIRFSRDGRKLVSASADNSIRIWDVASRVEVLHFYLGKAQYQARSIAIEGTFSKIAAGSMNGTVFLYDVNRNEKTNFPAHRDDVISLDFSPDGRYLVTGSLGDTVSDSNDPLIKKWDVGSGAEVPADRDTMFGVNRIRYSPDGKLIAACSEDGIIRIRDASSGQTVWTLQGHGAEVVGIAFSPDSRRLASASGDQLVKIWDLTSGQDLLTLEGHQTSVRSVVFSPDGATLFSGSFDGTIRIWRAASQHEVETRLRTFPK